MALGAFAIKEIPNWVIPFITAQIIDAVARGGQVTTVLGWFLLGVVLLAENVPFMVLFTRWYMTIVREVAAQLRNALAHRLQELSIGYHARASASVVQSKVVRDVENVELMLQQSAQPLLSALLVMLGAVITTALVVPAFLPIYVLAVPVALLLRLVLMRRSSERNENFRLEMEGFAANVGEMAALIPITRAHALEHVATARIAEGADRVRRAGLQLDLLNGRMGSASWASMQFLGLLCLGLAAVFSLSGLLDITAGQVVMLSSYFALLAQGITSLLLLLPIAARGIASARSIAEVLDDPDVEVNAGKQRVEDVVGDIVFEGVHHRYPGADRDSIAGLTLTVEAGQTVAFVGASGSGKSTLLNLVLGFVRPSAGRVLIDGRDMQTLDLRTLRRHVSVVPQESVLFEGTVRDNVAHGLPGINDDVISAALAAAHASDIVADHPRGLDRELGPRGSGLSGGQRQRLAIARALVRDPRILLLDEATSALDPVAERLVSEAFARLMRGRTTFVVAHRLSTVRAADAIVVLDSGRVVEMGTHESLLAAGGHYRLLYESQFERSTAAPVDPDQQAG
ncbi:MAG TPA: ABC transporter ATP-binding protein [Pseudolysinimonas sp.]|nr:ABC transporter ATP-binding protein [Pseudolysinimonas sp.]